MSANTPPHILSITTDHQRGGIANALVSYAHAAAKAGYSHSVILPPNAPICEQLETIGVKLIKMRPAMIYLLLWASVIFAPNLRSQIKTAHAIFVHNARLIRYMNRLNKRCFLICHSGKMRHIEQANHVIFLSQSAKQRAEKKLATTQRYSSTPHFHVIPHGFELPAQIRKKPTKNAPIRLIAAGRFVPKKRFDLLLEAGKQLSEKQIAFELNIYGEGALQPELEAMIDRYQLQHCVRLHGWSEQLSDEFVTADLFCLPSTTEPFGLVLCEAMAAGLPVIATKTDGALDILGEYGTDKHKSLKSGGLLIARDDASALATAIAFFYRYPEERKAAGKAARKRIKTAFSHDSLAEKLKQLLA